MKTTTRQKGTKVFECADGADTIEALRTIVKEKQYAVINEKMIDLFTASIVLFVFDSLNDQNKKIFLNFKLEKMILVSFKLYGYPVK